MTMFLQEVIQKEVLLICKKLISWKIISFFLMLYRYSVENYKSFKHCAELVMFPFAQEGVDGKTYWRKGEVTPVLKTCVIFGANASGKSNLIKSIAFAQSIILNDIKISTESNPCFKLDSDSIFQPTVFNFEMKIGERLLQYGFSVLFRENRLMEEWLYDLDTDTQLFLRVYNSSNQRYEFDYDKENLEPSEIQRVDIYLEDLQQDNTRLLLTELAGKKMSDSHLWHTLHDTYQWFKDLRILFPGSRYNLLMEVALDERRINEIYKTYFKLFDIHIDNIHLNSIPIEMLHLSADIMDEMKKDLLKASGSVNTFVMATHGGHEYLIDMDGEGNLLAKEVKFRHLKDDGVTTYDFDKSEESDGTKRLFDLIPALARMLSRDSVVIIDEIDRSLHSLLTHRLLRLFKQKSKDKNSQLICTTHEQLLLDGALFRPDELWMVNLDEKTSQSELYSLAQYKVKFMENIEKNYLLGRYKGIPLFDNLE